MKKLLKILSCGLLALVILPVVAGAVINVPGTLPSSPVQDVNKLLGVVDWVIRLIYTLFFAIAVVFVLYAGYLYLTAGGDGAKVTKASHQLIYAAIAVAVGLLSVGIEAIVKNILSKT